MSTADTVSGAIERGARSVTSALRSVREDLFTFPVQPLPPMRRFGGRVLPWLLHIAIVVYALILMGINAHHMYTVSGVSGMVAIALGVVQSTPVVLALFRPMAAWWMSLAATVVVAAMTFPSGSEATTQWPWTDPGLQAHLMVLILVALRVRVRVVVELWLLTVVVGGVLVAIQQKGDIYGNESLPLMAVLSATALIVTVAVRERGEALRQLGEQARLTSAERTRRTLLEERARIARELHDVVAHHMSVIAVQAEAAPYRVPDPPDELTRSLATIRDNAVDALTELRRVLGVLRAEDPDPRAAADDAAPQPTLDRVEELVGNVRAAGMDVVVTVTGSPRLLSPGLDLSAFRIVQEALSNALRHAPGAAVRVEISHTLAGLGLRIVNERSPQAVPPSPSGSRHGVLGMRERAAMLGGELSAGPTSDGGYEVTAFLPASESEDE